MYIFLFTNTKNYIMKQFIFSNVFVICIVLPIFIEQNTICYPIKFVRSVNFLWVQYYSIVYIMINKFHAGSQVDLNEISVRHKSICSAHLPENTCFDSCCWTLFSISSRYGTITILTIYYKKYSKKKVILEILYLRTK